MKGQKTITSFGAVSALALFVVGACGGSGTADIAGDADLRTIPDDPSAITYALGSKLANLSGQDSTDFDDGLVAFSSNEGPADGLGPVFNGQSCGQCHVHRSCDVLSKQQALGSHGIGMMLFNQFDDAIVNHSKSVGQCDFGRFDQTVVQAFQL